MAISTMERTSPSGCRAALAWPRESSGELAHRKRDKGTCDAIVPIFSCVGNLNLQPRFTHSGARTHKTSTDEARGTWQLGRYVAPWRSFLRAHVGSRGKPGYASALGRTRSYVHVRASHTI